MQSISIPTQIAWLFILAIPIACIAWTVTHEELFSELREFCKKQQLISKGILRRKFFYVFTCEYCFSFYVTALMLFITKYQLLFGGWRGYFYFLVFVGMDQQYLYEHLSFYPDRY